MKTDSKLIGLEKAVHNNLQNRVLELYREFREQMDRGRLGKTKEEREAMRVKYLGRNGILPMMMKDFRRKEVKKEAIEK